LKALCRQEVLKLGLARRVLVRKMRSAAAAVSGAQDLIHRSKRQKQGTSGSL
jgi:hypothetical protein